MTDAQAAPFQWSTRGHEGQVSTRQVVEGSLCASVPQRCILVGAPRSQSCARGRAPLKSQGSALPPPPTCPSRGSPGLVRGGCVSAPRGHALQESSFATRGEGGGARCRWAAGSTPRSPFSHRSCLETTAPRVIDSPRLQPLQSAHASAFARARTTHSTVTRTAQYLLKKYHFFFACVAGRGGARRQRFADTGFCPRDDSMAPRCHRLRG